MLLSCNPNNPTPNPPAPNSVQTSWTMTVDNTTYSWSDNYLEYAESDDWYPEHFETNPGCCEWHNDNFGVVYLGTGNLPGQTEDAVECHLQFYPMNTGSWIISGNSWQSGVNNPSAFYLEIVNYPSINSFGTNSVAWNMITGNDNITLNITEFATAIGGHVKGNFNGSYYDVNNVLHTVSGQFNAIRRE
jgi:hypothetical protein